MFGIFDIVWISIVSMFCGALLHKMFSGWAFFKHVTDKDALKKLNKYVIYAKDTFNCDLGCLQYTQSAVDVSFDDFPKPWTSNVTSRPLKVTVEAASARDAMEQYLELVPDDETARKEMTFLSTR